MVILTTLSVIVKDKKILLQKKAKGKFGEGKWNGAGGKAKQNEKPRACLIRELKEELGIKVNKFHLVGFFNFYKGEDPKPFIICYTYVVKEFSGTPTSSEEGIINWFDINDIPFSSMWADDKHWLPRVLAGERLFGDFWYSPDLIELTNFNLRKL